MNQIGTSRRDGRARIEEKIAAETVARTHLPVAVNWIFSRYVGKSMLRDVIKHVPEAEKIESLLLPRPWPWPPPARPCRSRRQAVVCPSSPAAQRSAKRKTCGMNSSCTGYNCAS